MSGQQKLIHNARVARHKAIHQMVYISDIKGCHTLETGVAYHYRGHFIYAYPACVPVEPIPYSTKKGINLVGVAQHLVPPYDPNAPDLVEEYTISTLKRACIHESEYQKEQEELRKKETEEALEENAKPKEEVMAETVAVAVATKVDDDDVTATYRAAAPQHVSSAPLTRVSSKTTLFGSAPVASRNANTGISLAALKDTSISPAPLHNTSISPAALNSTSISLAALNNTSISLAALNKAPRMGTVEAPSPTYASSTLASSRFTPHDRGHYLAYSAPGSRQASINNTPLISRAVTPNNGLSVPDHGLLHTAASTTRLEQLLAQESVLRSLSSLGLPGVSVREGLQMYSAAQGMEPDEVVAFVESVSQRPSRQTSRQQSRNHSPSDDEKDGLFLNRFGRSHVTGTSTSRKRTPGAHSRFVSSSDSEDAKEFAVILGRLERNHARSLKVLAEQKKPVLKESETPRVGSQTKPSPLSQTMINRDPRSPTWIDMSATSPFAFPSIQETGNTPFPDFQDLSDIPRSPSYMPTHTGRSRAASKILNEAYNASNPSTSPRTPTFPPMAAAEKPDAKAPATASTLRCSVHHSEACDGKFVSQKHLTQRYRESSGFKDLVPTINCVDGRTMVDWAMIRDQEMEKMRIEKGGT